MDRNEKKYCTAVVLAAGRGTRMGTKEAKQYLEIAGKPVLVYALEAFERSPLIDQIILMTDEAHVEYCRSEIVEACHISKVKEIGTGGKERYHSVWNALNLIEGQGDRLAAEGIVMIHDGARPFITEEILERAYWAVLLHRACVTGMPVKDTIKLTDEADMITASPDRRLVWAAQTPQTFEFSLLYQAFSRQMQEDCSKITDDAMVVESQLGIQVAMVEGSYENIKITTPEDLLIAEIFAKRPSGHLNRQLPPEVKSTH